jgi:hypothetical protein
MNGKQAMPNRTSVPDVRLDRIHSEAVREGIGERLRDTTNGSMPDMSDNLRDLIAQLPELDRESAPSLVPDIDAHAKAY